jgi:hypothetical protein
VLGATSSVAGVWIQAAVSRAKVDASDELLKAAARQAKSRSIHTGCSHALVIDQAVPGAPRQAFIVRTSCGLGGGAAYAGAQPSDTFVGGFPLPAPLQNANGTPANNQIAWTYSPSGSFVTTEKQTDGAFLMKEEAVYFGNDDYQAKPIKTEGEAMSKDEAEQYYEKYGYEVEISAEAVKES